MSNEESKVERHARIDRGPNGESFEMNPGFGQWRSWFFAITLGRKSFRLANASRDGGERF
jgi:hypothetical protein